MAVKIIIDRKVKRGRESDFAKLIRELRGKAISGKGYVSGKLSGHWMNRKTIS